MQEIDERISKDIDKFYANLKVIKEHELGPQEMEILRSAQNYCEDAKSWLDKKELYNAFASISYAHGLLDALLKLNSEE